MVSLYHYYASCVLTAAKQISFGNNKGALDILVHKLSTELVFVDWTVCSMSACGTWWNAR